MRKTTPKLRADNDRLELSPKAESFLAGLPGATIIQTMPAESRAIIIAVTVGMSLATVATLHGVPLPQMRRRLNALVASLKPRGVGMKQA